MKIMSASLDDVKDFDFVISEAFRIDVGLDSPNFREFYNQEYNRDFGSIGMTINAPIELISKNRTIPQRQIHLSYASNERLHLISARFIKSNRLEMLVTVDEFVENIKKSLYVHTFIDDGD
ncbi:TPA: hypothetical protein RSR97_004886, partial [Klebsiella pneumoniae]|nr:hypothetical protein [Klebsiella pneumoniae]